MHHKSVEDTTGQDEIGARVGPTLRHVGSGVRPRDRGLVHQLLAFAAAHEPQRSTRSGAPTNRNRADERQIRQVIEAGLAPMLYRASLEGIIEIPIVWRDRLHSADLTAQVRHGNLIDSANEIIDVCLDMSVPVTLLKGISTSEQYHPLAHERPMGDIDILVAEDRRESVEAALIARGYRRSDYEMDEGSNHGVPLFDDERSVWVDVHGSLFPADSALHNNHLFGPAHVASQSIDSMFHRRRIRRLTNELQLVYIAAYWLRDLTDNRMHPSFLPPLFDAVYLLKTCGRLNWEALFASLDNQMAMASLYILLAYLCRSGLNESAAPILPRLAAGQEIVGSGELRVILAILDRYLIGDKLLLSPFSEQRATVLLRTLFTMLGHGSYAGKLLRLPWNIAFPPLEPNRYRFRFHWNRVARVLGARSRDGWIE